MRVALGASALLLGLSVVVITATPSQTITPSTAPATAQNAAPAATPAALAAADDAAAKHAKRTACLTEAKARKLVGTEKNAFLKGCIDAP